MGARTPLGHRVPLWVLATVSTALLGAAAVLVLVLSDRSQVAFVAGEVCGYNGLLGLAYTGGEWQRRARARR